MLIQQEVVKKLKHRKGSKYRKGLFALKCLKCRSIITSHYNERLGYGELVWCKCGAVGLDNIGYDKYRIIGNSTDFEELWIRGRTVKIFKGKK